MSVDTHNIRVVYDVRGIDSSIRQSQRLLYFMNAVRLSVTDLQQVMSGPTIANVMWTAVQLTRVWTTAYRWVTATNQAQRVGMAQGMLGGVMGRGRGVGAAARATGVMGINQAMASLFDPNWVAPTTPWLTALLGSLGATLAIPGVAVGVGAAVVVTGAVLWDYNERRKRTEWLQRQREVAKNQGLEW